MAFVIVLVLILGGFKLVAPLVHALADAMHARLGRAQPPAGRDEQLDALREAVESLNDQVARLAERQDFTERLLEKPREAPKPEVSPREAPEPQVKTPTG